MGYDPNTGKIKQLLNEDAVKNFKQNVPEGVLFTEGEIIKVKGHDFYLHEVGESRLVLKPVKKAQNAG